MTRFRYPSGWNTKREPDNRPVIKGTWLDPCNKPGRFSTMSHKRSFQYWSQIHWATPPWMTSEMWSAIRKLYESSISGIHEVDHIVPLKHNLVCGLNVPWNLQRSSKRENQLKSNNWWPNCPDHLCPDKNATRDMFKHPVPYQMRLAI